MSILGDVQRDRVAAHKALRDDMWNVPVATDPQAVLARCDATEDTVRALEAVANAKTLLELLEAKAGARACMRRLGIKE